MLELINWFIGRIPVVLQMLNSWVIVRNFGTSGLTITVLGFIGALIVVSVTVKLLMPKV